MRGVNSNSTPAPRRKFGGAQPGSGRPEKDGVQRNFKLTHTANDACAATALKLGISKTAVVELALREYATKNGVEITDPSEAKT